MGISMMVSVKGSNLIVLIVCTNGFPLAYVLPLWTVLHESSLGLVGVGYSIGWWAGHKFSSTLLLVHGCILKPLVISSFLYLCCISSVSFGCS